MILFQLEYDIASSYIYPNVLVQIKVEHQQEFQR